MVRKLIFCMIFLGLTNPSCKGGDNSYDWKSMKVTATAYNSFPYQTSYEHPEITAWGDSLKPGMKCIAVSRDLIPLGLDYNTMVKIEGFDGIYRVNDKMHYRWKKRIDIYMGKDKQRALEWGRQKITIQYAVKKKNEVSSETPKP